MKINKKYRINENNNNVLKEVEQIDDNYNYYYYYWYSKKNWYLKKKLVNENADEWLKNKTTTKLGSVIETMSRNFPSLTAWANKIQ